MSIHGDFDLRWLEPFVTGIHIDTPPTRQLEKTFLGLTVASAADACADQAIEHFIRHWPVRVANRAAPRTAAG